MRRSSVIHSTLFVLSFWLAVQGLGAATLSEDFSVSANPTHGWSLGWKRDWDGPFALYTNAFPGTANGNHLAYWGRIRNSESFIRQNLGPDAFRVPDQGTFPVHGLSAAPGPIGRPDKYAVARYTISVGGVYHVAASGHATGAAPIDARVTQDGAELATRVLTPGESLDVAFERFLPAGTVIDVMTGRAPGWDNYGAILQFDVQITPAPSGAPVELSFLPPRGHFTNEMLVTIVNTTGTGEVRYTLDGTVPTAASTLYASPIRIDQSTLVRAALFQQDGSPRRDYAAAYHRIARPGDALPYTWIEHYFGPNGVIDPRSGDHEDPDGDGNDNLQEFLAGSDPLDPLSGFAVGIKTAPAIVFVSVPGQVYRVLRREKVDGTAIEVGQVTASGTRTRFVDGTAEDVNGYYSVEAVR